MQPDSHTVHPTTTVDPVSRAPATAPLAPGVDNSHSVKDNSDVDTTQANNVTSSETLSRSTTPVNQVSTDPATAPLATVVDNPHSVNDNPDVNTTQPNNVPPSKTPSRSTTPVNQVSTDPVTVPLATVVDNPHSVNDNPDVNTTQPNNVPPSKTPSRSTTPVNQVSTDPVTVPLATDVNTTQPNNVPPSKTPSRSTTPVNQVSTDPVTVPLPACADNSQSPESSTNTVSKTSMPQWAKDFALAIWRQIFVRLGFIFANLFQRLTMHTGHQLHAGYTKITLMTREDLSVKESAKRLKVMCINLKEDAVTVTKKTCSSEFSKYQNGERGFFATRPGQTINFQPVD